MVACVAESEGFVVGRHEVALAVHDDGCAFNPFWAVFGNPGSGGPFTDVVAAGKNA